MTSHASCLNLPWQTNSERDLDTWKRLYIKLSTDTDKDFVKTGRISGLISEINYRERSQKVKKQCARFDPVDHFNRTRKTKITGMAQWWRTLDWTLYANDHHEPKPYIRWSDKCIMLICICKNILSHLIKLRLIF